VTEWLPDLHTQGESLVRWVIWMNLWCAAIVAIALIADRLLVRRVAPQWRMLLLAAVFVRLALPLSFASPIGIAGSSGLVPVRISLGADAAADSTAGATSASRNFGGALAVGTAGPALTLQQLALPAYLAGIAILCGAWLLGARRLRRIADQSQPMDAPAGPRDVPILRHLAAGPMLIGILRPRLVIPADLESRAGARGLGWVLRHESAHIARRDPVLAAILHAAVIIAWPIAAAWVAAARIRGLMEEACDDLALRGESDSDRKEYARTLIELATPRTLSRFAPALPFGAGLRPRVRALSCTKRWPIAAQCGLAVALASVLVACAGTQNAGGEQSRAQIAVQNAETEPFKGSLPIRITILRSWPEHPKLNYALGQVRSGAPEPDWSIDRILTREEFAEVLSGATAADAGAVVSRPRLEVVPGMKASVSVGMEAQNGRPISGIMLDSTVTQVMIPAGSTARVYTMDVDFDRYGEAALACSAHARGIKVPEGQTLALLATGQIGGERLLVCISPGKDVVTTSFEEPAVAAQPAIADPRPLITFTTQIHRVDAPTDYGSPKGDGPRKNWSAYPGGQALSPKEFASYMTELRNRPGYVLLSVPRVSVYPDQEATIELQPEAEDPAAVHAIKLRGTPDGEFVRFTGSYARSAGGSTQEGSWNQSRPMAPMAGMVWSIHDPVHGAWYTVTIQAQTHEPGSIKPQTATGLPGAPGR
jgi:beta-lactamase regulating signal transducer with metallopeptidase domain